MTTRIFCFLTLCLSLLGSRADAQVFDWANGAHAVNDSSVVNITANAISADGDVFVAYSYAGSMTLGAQTLRSQRLNTRDIVVARFNSAGVFADILLTGIAANVTDLAFDGAGNLYASGGFEGQLTGPGISPITALGAIDLFVAKWNAAGVSQWVRQGQGTDTYRLRAAHLAVDGAGNVTIATAFTGSLTIGNQTTTTLPTSAALLLAQFNPAGTFRWSRSTAAGADSIDLADLAAAPNGTLYVVGSNFLSDRFTWGTTPILTPGTTTNYWLKLDASGSYLDQQYFNGSGAIKVATDATSGCYALVNDVSAALRWGTATFNPPNQRAKRSFILSLGATHVPQWVQTVDLTVWGYLYCTALCVSQGVAARPQVYVGGEFFTNTASASLVCGTRSLRAVANNQYDGFVLALEGDAGNAVWLRGGASTSDSDGVYALAANAAGELSVSGSFEGDSTYFDGIRVRNPLTRADFTAKLTQQYNQIQGTVFTDPNRNATRDAGEPGLGGIIVETQPGPRYVSTDTNGQYGIAVTDLGTTYTLSVPNPPRYYRYVPTGPTTATFSTYGNLSTGHDFALQPIPNQQDLQVFLTPVSRARPGFAVTYRLTARNVGTVAVASTLRLTTDALLTYVSSTPAGSQSGSTINWNSGTLQPGETRDFDALFQLAVTAPLGHVLTATAVLDPLSGDLTPVDNTEVNQLTVTGSYDPNDIAVNYATLTLPQVQGATRPLDYTVRFQNIGTDTAFTVVLRDTLPADLLNLGTLQMLAASHSCTWRLRAGGVLTVSFPNIRLPHRNANTLRSMGYVRFRVVPRTTLALGDLIPNQARIYFDFNAPVATNTALTTVANPNGLPPDAAGLMGGAWPNPARDALHVSIERLGGAALTVTLTDALGRVVRTQAVAAGDEQGRATLDVRGLTPGLYVVRAAAGGRGWSQRVLVR